MFYEQTKGLIYPLLSDNTFKDDDELYLHLTLIIADIFLVAMHVFLFSFFLWAKIGVLSLMCLGSIVFDLVCILLLRKKHYVFCGIGLSAEVMVFTVAAAYLVGADNSIVLYLIVLLVMQIIIPYGSAILRGVITFAILLCTIAVALMQGTHAPVIELGSIKIPLTMFNTQLAFWGILLALFAGTFIKKVITQYRAEQLETFKTQAHIDPLSGLYNRRYADIVFERIAAGQMGPLWSAAMLDIDDFKMVNDAHGHAVGDVVLRRIAELCGGGLRKTDFVFRWGGEEFVLLLGGVDVQTAYHILEKLRCSITEEQITASGSGEPGTADAPAISVTVTIGAAELQLSDIPASIDACDKKMYAGKCGGKNTVVI